VPRDNACISHRPVGGVQDIGLDMESVITHVSVEQQFGAQHTTK
jgi:hypothetical protein